MEQEKIDRINELARKSRCAELTAEERDEQKKLREEYVAEFRKNLENQLDSVYILDGEGNKKKFWKKD